MFYWEKKGKLYDPTSNADRPDWAWDFAQGENTLIFDDYVRVYFCTREKADEFGRTISRISFLDLDKKDLFHVIRVSEKPIVSLGGLGTFNEFGMYPFCPIRVDDKIYGYYGGITRCESVPFNSAIGCVVSYDNGQTFQKLGDGPILSYSLEEPFIIGSPKVRYFNGLYYMTYSSGQRWVQGGERPEICYKMRMAISEDGVNWVKQGQNLLSDTLGEEESQACGDIIFKNNKYHMFFCYRKNLNFRTNKNNSYRIGYAWSKDLVNWNREDDKAGIDISENAESFDSVMVAYPHIFELGNKIYMLYLGNEVGKYGFGLAELCGELE